MKANLASFSDTQVAEHQMKAGLDGHRAKGHGEQLLTRDPGAELGRISRGMLCTPFCV